MTWDIGQLFDEWWEFARAIEVNRGSTDLDLYVRLAKVWAPPSLELGIGDGRVAQAVKPTYGVDLSSKMLEKCAERLKDDCPILIKDDFKTYRLPMPARFTYSPQNAVNHVPPEEREQVFCNVLRNTEPGGAFVFASLYTSEETLRTYNMIPILQARTRTFAIYQVSEIIDMSRQETVLHAWQETLDVTGVVIQKRYFRPMPWFVFQPGELEDLAAKVGWQVSQVWGGYNNEPVRAESRRRVTVLIKPE